MKVTAFILSLTVFLIPNDANAMLGGNIRRQHPQHNVSNLAAFVSKTREQLFNLYSTHIGGKPSDNTKLLIKSKTKINTFPDNFSQILASPEQYSNISLSILRQLDPKSLGNFMRVSHAAKEAGNFIFEAGGRFNLVHSTQRSKKYLLLKLAQHYRKGLDAQLAKWLTPKLYEEVQTYEGPSTLEKLRQTEPDLTRKFLAPLLGEEHTLKPQLLPILQQEKITKPLHLNIPSYSHSPVRGVGAIIEDTDGNLIIGEYSYGSPNSLYRINHDGSITFFVKDRKNFSPTQIVLDPTQRSSILVYDSKTWRILRFDTISGRETTLVYIGNEQGHYVGDIKGGVDIGRIMVDSKGTLMFIYRRNNAYFLYRKVKEEQATKIPLHNELIDPDLVGLNPVDDSIVAGGKYSIEDNIVRISQDGKISLIAKLPLKETMALVVCSDGSIVTFSYKPDDYITKVVTFIGTDKNVSVNFSKFIYLDFALHNPVYVSSSGDIFYVNDRRAYKLSKYFMLAQRIHAYAQSRVISHLEQNNLKKRDPRRRRYSMVEKIFPPSLPRSTNSF